MALRKLDLYRGDSLTALSRVNADPLELEDEGLDPQQLAEAAVAEWIASAPGAAAGASGRYVVMDRDCTWTVLVQPQGGYSVQAVT